jgi:GMP synthase (glutamine-hydrolysing)
MGDQRTYEYVAAIRIVESSDGMTATVPEVPIKLLRHIANKIINEVRGINRITFDLTGKPPSTIEWE